MRRRLARTRQVSGRFQGPGEPRTSVALTHGGRAALERYTSVLRQLLGPAIPG